jgi:hypothetical protein
VVEDIVVVLQVMEHIYWRVGLLLVVHYRAKHHEELLGEHFD